MIDIIILTMVVILLILFFVVVVKRIFFTSYYDKCYEDMKNRGDAMFGTCCGQSGGDKYTDYLSYSCVNCPYFNNLFKYGEKHVHDMLHEKKDSEKGEENESTSNVDD